MLLCVALVNFMPFLSDLSPIMAMMNTKYNIKYLAAGQGVAFLLYPLLGLLADLVFSRYKVIAAGSVVLSIGVFFIAVFASTDAYLLLQLVHRKMFLAFTLLLLVLVIISFGMVEANALQFGMDQLTEASGEQLGRFVHWYFWVIQLGSFLAGMAGGISLMLLPHRYMVHYIEFLTAVLATVSTLLLLLASVVVCVKKHSLNTARFSGNPLKNILRVLEYSWQHTIPENRSALTYWEEDIPTRIDLGKNKYGGPFTNEEVEDVKTFFHMLVVLLSLIGFHFAGDTFSLSQQLEIQQGCPSIPALLGLILDPYALPTTLVVVVLPLYQTAVVQRALVFLRLNMIRRMWIGLLCSVLQVFCEIAIFRANVQDWSAGPSLHFHIDKYSKNEFIGLQTFPSGLPTMIGCYILDVSNQTLVHASGIRYTLQNSAYYWLLVPQLLMGLSMLLVSMTALEFICAQAPQTLQGLLIGLWYAMYSIRYLLVAILDTYFTSSSSWYIYQGCKACAILVSLLLYSWVSRWYRYRERDEVVNVQQMIEDIHERNLDLEEEYEEEQRRYERNLDLEEEYEEEQWRLFGDTDQHSDPYGFTS